MRKEEVLNETEEPLVDTTVAIPIRSKRTERRQKRRQQKEKAHNDRISLLNLPSELVIYILGYLRPSDIFVLSRVSHSLRQFNIQQEPNIATEVIKSRYSALSKCFQLPVLLEKVDAGTHAILQSEKRQELLNIHKKPYQHIKSPDPSLICTCLTCVLAWNNLCVVVDFANWQDNLDANPITPIPIIPRGKYPEWNQFLMSANTAVVHNALHSPLWCVRILEQHLKSTVRAIRRHGNNKGNQRRRFRMAVEDAASESDGFLERSGPPSLDFPFHRDNYYMLEAYLPNRGWNGEQSRWMYAGSQHDRDLEFVKAWAARQNLNLQDYQTSPPLNITERPSFNAPSIPSFPSKSTSKGYDFNVSYSLGDRLSRARILRKLPEQKKERSDQNSDLMSLVHSQGYKGEASTSASMDKLDSKASTDVKSAGRTS